MRIAIFAVLCTIFSTVATARTSTLEWTIDVNVRGNDGIQHSYTTKAWVYSASQWYSGTIYAIGPYRVPDRSLPVVKQFDDIKSRQHPTVVFSGGFSKDVNYSPDGLLLVAGRVANPFLFEKNSKGDFELSAVVCQSLPGQLSLKKTQDYVTAGSKILNACWSAFQSGPMVVEDGHNVINSAELQKPSYVRTILGFDKKNRPRVVIFEKPVHLFIAAEFLRGEPAAAPVGQATVSGDPRDPNFASKSGLGLREAVNLNGDAFAICEYWGKPKFRFGNSANLIPSAIAIRSQ